MSRAWSGQRRFSRQPAAPRSFWRRLLDYLLAAAILGFLALIAARLDRVETRRPAGTAIVNDGDTLTLGTERIRLRGIDAPEFSQVCRRDGAEYACGRLARDSLRGLIRGKSVSCTGWERDRYGRLLGTCSAGDVDLNAAQVEAGWAIAYGDYELEEARASAKGAGIWAGSFDRPRDWRDMHGDMADTEHNWLGKAWNWLRQVFWVG